MPTENEQKAIEEVFLWEWDRRKEYYDNLTQDENWGWLVPAKAFVRELRTRGYDRHFIVARPYHLFVLARSHSRELPSGKESLVSFKFRPAGGMRIQYYETGQLISEFEVASVEITPEIEALLERLLAQPID